MINNYTVPSRVVPNHAHGKWWTSNAVKTVQCCGKGPTEVKSMMLMIRIFKNLVKAICLEASPKINCNQWTIPSSSRRWKLPNQFTCHTQEPSPTFLCLIIPYPTVVLQNHRVDVSWQMIHVWILPFWEGRRKAISQFLAWQRRLPLLTTSQCYLLKVFNGCKSSICSFKHYRRSS